MVPQAPLLMHSVCHLHKYDHYKLVIIKLAYTLTYIGTTFLTPNNQAQEHTAPAASTTVADHRCCHVAAELCTISIHSL